MPPLTARVKSEVDRLPEPDNAVTPSLKTIVILALLELMVVEVIFGEISIIKVMLSVP